MSDLEEIRLAKRICASIDLSEKNVARVQSSDHAVFFIDEELVLKVYNGQRNCFEREYNALELVAGRSFFSTPQVVNHGIFEGFEFLIQTRVPGKTITRDEFLAFSLADRIRIIENLAQRLRQLHSLNIDRWNSDWPEFIDERMGSFVARQIEHGVNSKIITQLPEYIRESICLIPNDGNTFLHGDVHLGNLCFDRGSNLPMVSGLFDFADSRTGCPEYDMLAVGLLIIQGERELQRIFFRAYGYAESELDAEMRRRLMMLTMTYETSDLRRYAKRLRPDAVDLDLYQLEEAIWNFV